VLNPYTPTDLAARLVVLLARTDQRAVAEDPSLHESVRAAARAALTRAPIGSTIAGGSNRGRD
jgi:hypothetical protein